ncbi:hypothetical protein PTSG_04493 [Salpingoeca rosetta]|uniref:Mitochondrial carrier protein n=1 Tax=Salpingoeca rosetta (strain ATCC 50818 / BSB-021) TaxID=946362 RepID=F2U8Q5_SALR5|nr:uncharacterized protein PTSG_04493 [Salpingoeca rosetta]EGD72763.1 hypothetical protein PTSG_04493 [Salpingoeca rosetta]|eukprot:XP_004994586.1 hypothetical protein PTSG_04493 [Salpingoeca rosetta]
MHRFVDTLPTMDSAGLDAGSKTSTSLARTRSGLGAVTTSSGSAPAPPPHTSPAVTAATAARSFYSQQGLPTSATAPALYPVNASSLLSSSAFPTPATTVITTTRPRFAHEEGDASALHGTASSSSPSYAGATATGPVPLSATTAATTTSTSATATTTMDSSGASQMFTMPWKTTALAAAAESFYRSALNSKINHVLTGVRGPLFPNMQVQLPTRVVYITGFKFVRIMADSHFNAANYPGMEHVVRPLAAVTPGVVMTPISSVLEACNANLSNEPLYKRWRRGFNARCGREVIFGIGLNQLSEHFEHRMPHDLSPAVRNAAGCVTAGVIAGYLSHVPHNLSTMKLMNPKQSYMALLKQFSRQWYSRLDFLGQGRARETGAVVMSLVLPQGLVVRTAQVVGSFIILNGMIHAFRARLGEA